MFGQNKLKNIFDTLYKQNKLSKCNILCAPKGFGKKEFIKYLSSTYNINYKSFFGNIEDIRKAIELSLDEHENCFYVFEDLENNKVAQNATLKFFEDPPINIIIFILVEDVSLLLPTILNRATVFTFEPYSKEELKNINKDELALELFDTPLELMRCKEIDLNQFINDVNKIVDKLDLANIGNALKLNSLIKSKDNESGYDLDLFIKILKYCYFQKYLKTNDDNFYITFRLLQKALRHKNLNSKYLLDDFLINNYLKVKANGNSRS